MNIKITMMDRYDEYAAKFEADTGYVHIHTNTERDFITTVCALTPRGASVSIVPDDMPCGVLVDALFSKGCDVSISRVNVAS